MSTNEMQDLLALVGNSFSVVDGKAVINDAARLRLDIHKLAEVAALESGPRQGAARYLVRLAALGLGIVPASIQDLYAARGRGEVPNTFTVPAINLRALAFDAATRRFPRRPDARRRSLSSLRSPAPRWATPTSVRPNTSPASWQLPSPKAITGPVFIQGDHFQVSAKRYAGDPETEVKAVKDLIVEALAAGFYNIDIDTSTLVDLSKSTIPEQQALNTGLSAMYTAYIRSLEPKGVTVSVGGEIGEVGGHNSTEEELCAYMDGYYSELEKLAPGVQGISKISIQTGTSHGGVVLPDGSIAKVSVDFDTLQKLSRIARDDYGMGGAVQHGASTLPEDAFGKFVEAEAVEVHLATNFQNYVLRAPAG